MPAGKDDHELIAAVKAGDQSAFAGLVKRYERYVFTLVLQFGTSREVAEELAQDVFVKAYRFINGFEGKSKFSTWLYTIVHSTCVSHLRTKKQLFSEGEHVLAKLQDEAIEAGSGHDRRHWQQVIGSALGKMQPEERLIITLFYQGEQSVREIAQITGLAVPNVKVKLFRARQRLRQLLSNTYHEYQSSK